SVRQASGSSDWTIVGVAADAVFRSGRMIPGVSSTPFREPVPPMMFLPLLQSDGSRAPGDTTFKLTVRPRSADPAATTRAVGAVIAATDRDIAYAFRPFTEYVDAAIGQERVLGAVSSSLAALSVLLSALGLYGLTTYAVDVRRRELGIRLALGAAPADLVRGILFRIAVLMAAGIAAGGLVGAWTSRLVAA